MSHCLVRQCNKAGPNRVILSHAIFVRVASGYRKSMNSRSRNQRVCETVNVPRRSQVLSLRIYLLCEHTKVRDWIVHTAFRMLQVGCISKSRWVYDKRHLGRRISHHIGPSRLDVRDRLCYDPGRSLGKRRMANATLRWLRLQPIVCIIPSTRECAGPVIFPHSKSFGIQLSRLQCSSISLSLISPPVLI